MIQEYLLRIRALVDSLQATGDPVTEQDHVDMILEGLPEYNSFVMVIYARFEPASVDDIEALLVVQDSQFQKCKQELPSSSVSLNVAQAATLTHGSSSTVASNGFQSNNGYQGSNVDYQDPSNGYQNSGRGRDCGGCGRGSRGRGRGGNRPTCQLCRRYGHEAYNSWYRFDQTLPALAPQFVGNNPFPAQNQFPGQFHQAPPQRPPPPSAFVATQFSSLRCLSFIRCLSIISLSLNPHNMPLSPHKKLLLLDPLILSCGTRIQEPHMILLQMHKTLVIALCLEDRIKN